MFSITDEAEIYVSDLFEQQDEKNLGLKVDVEKAGTPLATVTFNFCFANELPSSYTEYPFSGFSAYIDDNNIEYLKDSKVAHSPMELLIPLTMFLMFSLTSSPTSFVKYLKDPVRFISLGITLEA